MPDLWIQETLTFPPSTHRLVEECLTRQGPPHSTDSGTGAARQMSIRVTPGASGRYSPVVQNEAQCACPLLQEMAAVGRHPRRNATDRVGEENPLPHSDD
jgi:hypothetical protein